MKEQILKIVQSLLTQKKVIALVGGALIALAAALFNLPEGEVKEAICGKPDPAVIVEQK